MTRKEEPQQLHLILNRDESETDRILPMTLGERLHESWESRLTSLNEAEEYNLSDEMLFMVNDVIDDLSITTAHDDEYAVRDLRECLVGKAFDTFSEPVKTSLAHYFEDRDLLKDDLSKVPTIYREITLSLTESLLLRWMLEEIGISFSPSPEEKTMISLGRSLRQMKNHLTVINLEESEEPIFLEENLPSNIIPFLRKQE